jgi:hypothetical protein
VSFQKQVLLFATAHIRIQVNRHFARTSTRAGEMNGGICMENLPTKKN